MVGVAYLSLLVLAYGVSASFFAHDLANRLVSSLNAILVASLAVASLAGAGVDDSPPLVGLPAVGVECMCAFLIFDLCLGMARGFESGSKLMFAHHAMGLASEMLTLSLGVGTYSTMVVHLAEFSTPLLHLSWFMLKQGRGHTRIFLLTGVTLVAAFALVRVLLPLALLACYMARPSAEAHWQGFTAVYRFQLAIVAAFWILNCVWFAKLLRSARRSAPTATLTREARAQ